MGGSTDLEGSRIAAPDPMGLKAESQAGTWRQSKWLILIELIVVALIFVADARKLIPFSKTPFLLVLGWISLWLRKIRWRDMGLGRYRTWRRTLGLGLGAGLVLEAVQLFISQPILVRILAKQPDLALFRALHGNLQ